MRKLSLLVIFVALLISDLALASDDLYRWIDPLTGQTILNSSPPNNYPIKEQRITGNLPSGKGHQIDVIIDINSPNLDPKIKTLIEKRKIQQAEEKIISEDKKREREAQEAERQRIAEEKAKEQARQTEKQIAHVENDWRSTCGVLAELGKKIMQARQAGISMEKIIKVFNGGDFGEKITIKAYNIPRYNTHNVQEKSIGDFRDEMYLECAKIRNELRLVDTNSLAQSTKYYTEEIENLIRMPNENAKKLAISCANLYSEEQTVKSRKKYKIEIREFNIIDDKSIFVLMQQKRKNFTLGDSFTNIYAKCYETDFGENKIDTNCSECRIEKVGYDRRIDRRSEDSFDYKNYKAQKIIDPPTRYGPIQIR